MTRVGMRWVALPLVAGCGGRTGMPSNIAGVDSLDGSASTFGAEDAGPPSGLSVSVVPGEPAICAGQCTALMAQATGGVPPYAFALSPSGASDGDSIYVCPGSSTTYTITATDSSGHVGELGGSPNTGSAKVTVAVSSCRDGAMEAPTESCDSVADVSPSGANPNGPWSYGWSTSLGTTFSPYSHYFASASGYNGLDAWSSGATISLQDPYDSLPAAFVNPFSTAIQVSTLTAQPGQFFVHPGPSGQYSIARWTARQPGAYDVRATFEGIDSGPTTTDAHIRHGGLDLVPAAYINLNGDGNSFSFETNVTVAAGDTIDFAVGNGGNGFLNDSTAVDAEVCSTSDAGK